MINRADERVDAAILNTESAQIFHRFFLAQIRKFAFDPGADYKRFRSEMMLSVILNKIDILRRGICVIAFCNRSQIGLRDVAGKKGWFRRQEKEISCDNFILGL